MSVPTKEEILRAVKDGVAEYLALEVVGGLHEVEKAPKDVVDEIKDIAQKLLKDYLELRYGKFIETDDTLPRKEDKDHYAASMWRQRLSRKKSI
jgi:methyl coenzyme M reductase subunit D